MRSRTWCTRWGLLAIIVGLISFTSSPAAGQGGDASIIGQVTDQSGAVLPGVTVTATSPVLQVPSMTSVTNERGEYRLSPLPVGTYQVTYDLSGFRPGQRQDVRLTVGFTARIDIALGLATVAETVTVSGATPVVDVTATSGASLFTKEVLDLTPTTRNGAMSLLTMAPGVRSFIDIGGSQTEENSGAKAFGQSGQVYYTIEGVMGNNWTNAGGSGTFWDFQTIDEARVQSMATDPEFPTRGVQINAVVKAGGNNFHGGGLYAVTGNKLESDNLDQELKDAGVSVGNSVRVQNDISGDLGGRIIRNKLWF
jgi:Carboxypeptidase regulatory-like domain